MGDLSAIDKSGPYDIVSDEKYPPTLLIHAKNDHLVDLQQVNDFYKFLTGKQISTELYVVEHGHSDELIYRNPEVIEKIIEFLKKYMQ